MYVMDPKSGKGRRAMIKDKAVSLAHKEGEMIARTGRDLRNRAKGLKPKIAAAMRGEAPEDHKLAERVCSKVGRALTHPGAVEVSAHGGRITLEGDILKSEVSALLSAAEACKGVDAIDNQLRIHDSAKGVPALQGDGFVKVGGGRWSPGMALAAGALGAAATAYGARKRGATGAALGAAGMSLMAKSLRDVNAARKSKQEN